jgi:CHAT domain-containing protein/tetratricopeptide (TPR) repeat protein
VSEAVNAANLNDVERAVGLLEEAQKVRRDRLGVDDMAVLATEETRIQLALRATGDLQGGIVAADALCQTLGRRSETPVELLLRMRTTLAQMLAMAGDSTAAKLHLEAVLERCRAEPALPFRNQFYTRHLLAWLLLKRGDLEGASRLIAEMQQIAVPLKLPVDNPSQRDLEFLLAEVDDRRGNYASAEARYRALHASNVGPHDPRASVSLARTLCGLGRFSEAIDVIRSALPELRGRHWQEAALVQLIEAGAHETNREVVGEGLTRLVDDLRQTLGPAAWHLAPRQAAESVQRKQATLDVVLAYGTGWVQGTPDSDLEPAFALVETCRRMDVNAYLFARLADHAPADVRAETARLRAELRDAQQSALDATDLATVEEKERAERRLGAHFASLPGGRSLGGISSAGSLAHSLAPTEAAVGFWRYRRRSPEGPTPGPLRLLAFVLTSDAALRRVELGPLSAIEPLCQAWREHVLAGREAEAASAGERLRALVWDPVEAAAPGRARWQVALDDVLHTIPLDALPHGDQFVGDRIEILPVTTLRELAHRQEAVATPHSLLAMAAVDYDRRDGTAAAARKPAVGIHRGAPELGRGTGPWPILASARAEADAIAEVFAAHAPQDSPARLLTGTRATKDQLRQDVAGARFVHLVTHGWAAPETLVSTADDDPAARGAFGPQEIRGLLPMSLCGLVLAGANLPDGSREGMLTAEELATFDLSACELAVLSACVTHVGIRRAGQGVASLQQALHAAGARASITSLWHVDDQATAELMAEFYRALWQDGQPRAVALWRAKQALRSRLAGNGQPRHGLRHWAGWVLTESP